MVIESTAKPQGRLVTVARDQDNHIRSVEIVQGNIHVRVSSLAGYLLDVRNPESGDMRVITTEGEIRITQGRI